MAFRVDITDAALADAEDFVEYVRLEKRDAVGAERWWNGLLDALFALEQQPGGGSLVFDLDDQSKVIRVLRIYHSSRRELRRRDVPR